MLNTMYGGSVMRFFGFTLFNWAGAMLLVYLFVGPSSINQWSALGALAMPAFSLVYQLVTTLYSKWFQR